MLESQSSAGPTASACPGFSGWHTLLQCAALTAQFGVICKFPDDAKNPTVNVIGENAEEHQSLY